MPALFDTYRFKANDGMGAQSVYPLASGLKQKWERDGDNRSYRIKITTPMVFRGADYDYFRAIYDTGDCTEVTFLIEQYCGGVWADWYEGVLPIRDGEYNASRCEVRFEIIPDDVYECANKSFEKKTNWLDYASPLTIKTLQGTLETISCNQIGLTIATPSLIVRFFKHCWSATNTTTSSDPDPALAWRPVEHWQDISFQSGPAVWKIQGHTTWAREKAISVASPPGVGWINISGTTWVRPVPSTVVIKTRVGVYGIQYEARTINASPISNGRILSTVLQEAVTATGCPIDSVVSNFFNINPDATAPTNDAYDYAAANFESVFFFQKSDIVRASATNDATRFEFTVKDFLDEIKTLNLFWAIVNEAGVIKLRIEHYTYFEGVNGLNLVTLAGGKYITGMNRFKTKESIPAFESFAWQESYRLKFLTQRIEYPANCVNAGGIDRSARQLSTDFGGLVENNDAGLEGFFLMATEDIGGGAYLMNTLGGEANGAFAWENLLPALWADGRYRLDATATVPGYVVSTVRKTRQQGVITIKFPCSQAFEASKLVNTQLGWGEVEDAEEDTERCTLKLNLLQ